MLLSRRLVAAVVLVLVGITLSAHAQTARTTVSFILVNDIYQMSAQIMADGNSRGGFAKLAAVAKAGRAKGGHVVFAHAGDTLSPSLMAGLDRGAHIISLTNMIAPDIFVPGNHEFDFGKAVFFQRMGEARFPLFAANLRSPDGAPLAGFRDRAIVNFDGVRVGLTGATSDDAARVSALRREGADFVVAVVQADRRQDYELFATRAIDLILSGHDHDLFVNFDGRTAMVESSYDAHYVTIIDVAIDYVDARGQTRDTVVAANPHHRYGECRDGSGGRRGGCRFRGGIDRELDVPLGTTAVELDSRSSAKRRSAISSPMPCASPAAPTRRS